MSRASKTSNSARAQPFEQDVTLEPGQPNELAPFPLPTAETRQAHDSNVRLHRTWGWVGVPGGAALAGAGVAWLVAGPGSGGPGAGGAF